MWANWNGDRAIGFVVGIVFSGLLTSALANGSPWPAIAGLVVLAVGVFLPKVRGE